MEAVHSSQTLVSAYYPEQCHSLQADKLQWQTATQPCFQH